MAGEPRVVAHLGRPETPEETAARKAESSRNYRGSQTFRNLIVALLVSLAIVVVIVWGVPRGSAPERAEIDVAEVAASVASTVTGPVVVPETPEGWTVNLARFESGAVDTWNVTYGTTGPDFLRFTQAFGADATWAAQRLDGAAPTGTVDVDGITWDVYEISNAADHANISYALGLQAGADHVLLYGSSSAEKTAELAASLSGQLAETTGTDEGTTE
ncbi:DUF4245 domain-containing protein [Microbacterium sp. NPDC055683]